MYSDGSRTWELGQTQACRDATVHNAVHSPFRLQGAKAKANDTVTRPIGLKAWQATNDEGLHAHSRCSVWPHAYDLI